MGKSINVTYQQIHQCKLCGFPGQFLSSKQELFMNACLHTICQKCHDNSRLCCETSEKVPHIIAIHYSKYQRLVQDGGIEQIPCENCKLRTVYRPSSHKCLQCKAFICAKCVETHHKIFFLKEHCLYPSSDFLRRDQLPVFLSSTDFCNIHTDCQLSYWCNTCDVTVCFDCLIVRHRNHETEGLRNVLMRKTRDIVLLKKHTDSIEELMKRNIDKRRRCLVDIDDQQNKVLMSIKQTHFEPRDKQQLVDVLQIIGADQKTFLRQNEPSNEMLETIQNSNIIASISIFLGSAGTIFDQYVICNMSMIQRQLEKFIEMYKLEHFDILPLPTTFFSTDSLWRVPIVANCWISPYESTLTCDNVCLVGKTCTATFEGIMKGERVNPSEMSLDHIQVLLSDTINENKILRGIKSNEDGTLTIKFKPKHTGGYKLLVFINGHPLITNPKQIQVDSHSLYIDPSGIVHMKCIMSPDSLENCLVTANRHGIVKIYHRNAPFEVINVKLNILNCFKTRTFAFCNNYIAVVGQPIEQDPGIHSKLIVFNYQGIAVMKKDLSIKVEDVAIISENENDINTEFKVLLLDSSDSYNTTCITQIESTSNAYELHMLNFHYRKIYPLNGNKMLLFGKNRMAIWENGKIHNIRGDLGKIYTIIPNRDDILVALENGKNTILRVLDMNGKTKKTMPVCASNKHKNTSIVTADRIGNVYIAVVKKGQHRDVATFPTEILKFQY